MGADGGWYDVVVAGCGPVGAAVANLLGQAGLSVLILEQATGVYPQPRAIHLDDEAMRVFQAMGLAHDITAVTRPIEGMHLLDAGGRTLLALRKNEAALPPYGFPAANMFHQPALEAILRQGLARFAQVELRQGWTLETFTQDGQGVTVTARRVDDGEPLTVHGRYLLACDGAGSRVRRLAGLALQDFHMDQPWLVVDTRLRTAGPTPDVVCQFCDPARPATYVPASGDRRRWEFMILPGESAEAMLQPAQVRRLLSRHIDPAHVQIERAAVYTFHALLAVRWQDRRLFLLGDAAHQMPPFLGQGLCAGIRDAHNLAWKLALVLRGQASPALLDTYERERRPHVARILQLVRWAGALIQTRQRPLAFLRDTLLRAATAIPPIRRRLRQLETIVPNLRRGCLDPGNQLAGRLMPQPTVHTAGGRALLLDELLGDGFALITLGEKVVPVAVESGTLPLLHLHILPPGSAQPPTGDPLGVVDTSGLLWQWCRAARAQAILVRPDRYVFGAYSEMEIGAALARLHHALATASHGMAEP